MHSIVDVLAVLGVAAILVAIGGLVRGWLRMRRLREYHQRLLAIEPMLERYPATKQLLITLPPGHFLGLLTFLQTSLTFHERIGGDMREMGFDQLVQHGIYLRPIEIIELKTMTWDDMRTLLDAAVPPF